MAVRQGRVWIAALGAAAVALVLNVFFPTDDLGSIEMLPALIGKVLAATAVYVALASRLARDELREGIQAIRSLRGRRPATG
jgi:hypothetical protein